MCGIVGRWSPVTSPLGSLNLLTSRNFSKNQEVSPLFPEFSVLRVKTNSDSLLYYVLSRILPIENKNPSSFTQRPAPHTTLTNDPHSFSGTPGGSLAGEDPFPAIDIFS